jgi:hypothetical protein
MAAGARFRKELRDLGCACAADARSGEARLRQPGCTTHRLSPSEAVA